MNKLKWHSFNVMSVFPPDTCHELFFIRLLLFTPALHPVRRVLLLTVLISSFWQFFNKISFWQLVDLSKYKMAYTAKFVPFF
jgi:hypothetical protein